MWKAASSETCSAYKTGFVGRLRTHPHAEFLKKVLEDALQRLVFPSLEREVRGELTDEAEAHAAAVFARNLRSLLLQPPLRHR